MTAWCRLPWSGEKRSADHRGDAAGPERAAQLARGVDVKGGVAAGGVGVEDRGRLVAIGATARGVTGGHLEPQPPSWARSSRCCRPATAGRCAPSSGAELLAHLRLVRALR